MATTTDGPVPGKQSRAELHVPEECGGDGEHDGEYGAEHEKEAFRSYGRGGSDQVVALAREPAVAGVGELNQRRRVKRVIPHISRVQLDEEQRWWECRRAWSNQ